MPRRSERLRTQANTSAYAWPRSLGNPERPARCFYVLSSRRVLKETPHAAGDEALDAASRFAVGLAFAGAAGRDGE